MPSKGTWFSFWDPYLQKFICYKVTLGGTPAPPLDRGKSAYRAVNLNRFLQGLPIIDNPPTDTWDGTLASLTVTPFATGAYTAQNLFHGVQINLYPGYGSIADPFSVNVYVRATQNQAAITRVDRRQRYVTTFTILSNTTVDITPQLALTNSYYEGCWINILAEFSWPGSLIKFSETFGIRNVT